MLRCPACGRQIRVICGTFPCLWCGEKLRWDSGFTVAACVLLGIMLFLVPNLIAFWMWPADKACWLGPLLVFVLCVPITLVFGFIRGAFFPSPVKKDSGWQDDGTILHITSPPEPPKES